jgi:hypothetical protein
MILPEFRGAQGQVQISHEDFGGTYKKATHFIIRDYVLGNYRHIGKPTTLSYSLYQHP